MQKWINENFQTELIKGIHSTNNTNQLCINEGKQYFSTPKYSFFVEFSNNRVGYAAATAAKSLQSCPTLCDPIDGSPPGSPVPGILQARTLEWVAISFSNA